MSENKMEQNEKCLDETEDLKEDLNGEGINNEDSTDSHIEALKDIIKVKEEEVNELNNRIMRLQADFINYKRRADKDKENSISNGVEYVIADLLPIIDNFQRALNSETDKENNFYKGISMIEQQLINLLGKHSVEEIESLGQPFDPNFHDAVFMEESDKYESGIITEVLQKGYKIKERIIRPSMVKVSK